MSGKLHFDEKIQWKDAYYRNCRSKYEKHLLCFPDHFNGKHRVYFLLLFSHVYFVDNLLKFIMMEK